MSELKIGFVITMYNEYWTVLQSINNLKKTKNNIKCVVIHSSDDTTNNYLEQIKSNSDFYQALPNLGGSVHKDDLPSISLCRNYSAGFTKLYELDDFDFVIGLTGDTLILNVDDLISKVKLNKIGNVLQAKGSFFWQSNEKSELGHRATRFQGFDCTDIQPQLFIFDGEFAKDNKLFTNIEITNYRTSEQCLGDEINKHITNYKESICRLHENINVYDFHHGAMLQYNVHKNNK
jgi:hypothetical protein